MSVAPILPCAGEAFGEVLAVRGLPNFVLRESRYAGGLDMPCHRHPSFYLAYLVRGGIEERTPSGTRRFTPGSLHTHPAEEPHSVRSGPEGMTILSLVPSAAIASRIASAAGRLTEAQTAMLGVLAGGCQREMRATDSAADLALESLALELVARLLRSRATPERGIPRWLAQVRDYLHAHHSERVRLAALSELAGIHEVHLVRAFRRAFGVTPGAYLRGLRIEEARRALTAPDCAPLADLALSLGFSSQAHFSRIFRALVGTSPGDFRRQHVGRSGPARSIRARTLRS